MEDFLKETKQSLNTLHHYDKVKVVLGNEACDLDSAVSALVYAFFLYKGNTHHKTAVIPLLNIPRHEYRLRTEVTYFLEGSNITEDMLTFQDEIDLKSLHEEDKLMLVLVDHNILSNEQLDLEPAVVEVIDHHKKVRDDEDDRYEVTIEMVGSCCTLVAEKVLNKEPSIVDNRVARLLYGTILLDTVNLADSAKRVTPKDKEVAERLGELLVDVTRDDLFFTLQNAKTDVSGLTIDELLRKDQKVISNATMSIAVASIPMLVDEFITRADFGHCLADYCNKHNYHILVLMGLHTDMETCQVTRQLGIYSPTDGYREQMVELLESCRKPRLQLDYLKLGIPLLSAFNQGNIAASRKVILPLLSTFLIGDKDAITPLHPTPGESNESDKSQPMSPLPSRVSPVMNPSSEVLDIVIPPPPNGLTRSAAIAAAAYTQYLGAGDPLSSRNSSNQNSSPYTPLNSMADGDLDMDTYAKQLLPSFNSRDMMEKIESKRGKLCGYDEEDPTTSNLHSYPFTPKNSFVEQSFDHYAQKNVLSYDLDSETIFQKLQRRKESLEEEAIEDLVAADVEDFVLDDCAKGATSGYHSDEANKSQLTTKSSSDNSGTTLSVANCSPSPESGVSSGHESNPSPEINNRPTIDPRQQSSSHPGYEDVEMDTDYQPETVDFPASPKQMKLMFQNARSTQGLTEDYMDDQSDEMFVAVLSPGSEDVRLRRGARFNESSQDDSSHSLLSPFSKQINSENFSITDMYIDDSLSYLNNMASDPQPQQQHFTSTLKKKKGDAPMAIPPEDESCDPPSPVLAEQSIPFSEIGSDVLHATGEESRATNFNLTSTMEKIQHCFEESRIKDLYVLGVRLQDMLTADEIDELLRNKARYSHVINGDIFEALSLTRMEKSEDKRKISVSRDELNSSLLEDLEGPDSLCAVFETRAPSCRLADKSLNTPILAKRPKTLNCDDVELSSLKKKISISREALGSPSNMPNSPSEVMPVSNGGVPFALEPEVHQLEVKLERPSNLSGNKKRKKILVHPGILDDEDAGGPEDEDKYSLSSVSNKSEIDVFSPIDDLVTPDDIDTPDDLDDIVRRPPELIPELSAAEELDEERSWRTCVIAGVQRKIDLKVIEPYKKVISHAGYHGNGKNATIIFSACHLPDHGRKDYGYVMDNLFLYVLTTLDELVTEDYVLVYLHGATTRTNMPTFGWLKKCYQMIDRRLRKNLKRLYMVHPTFWLKTIVIMTRPFISSKFYRKLEYVYSLQELTDILPIDMLSIPDKVKQLEFQMMIKQKKKQMKNKKFRTVRFKSEPAAISSTTRI